MMQNLSEASDLELITLLKESKEKAFDEIYARYWQPLVDSASKRISSDAIIEEIIQDLFLTLWLRRQEIVINSSLAAYLFTALRYHIRSQVVFAEYTQHVRHFLASQDTPTPEQTLAFLDLQASLQSGIEGLPPACRKIFELSRYEGLSTREIAIRLGLSDQTVSNQISKALSILRTRMSEFLTVVILLSSHRP